MFSSQQADKFTMDKYFPEIMSSMKKAAHTYARCLRINISTYCRGDICPASHKESDLADIL